jgi:N-acetylmuramoyl-L-alanine amidase
MTERRSTKYIAVHCSATRPSMDVGVTEIRKWHKAPPNNWDDIGYHYVIRRDGRIERGRGETLVGSHVKGFNAVSIGVCLVGGVNQDDFTKAENNFTKPQFASLRKLLRELKLRYPDAAIQGHRDFPKVSKACPSFDVRAWLGDLE